MPVKTLPVWFENLWVLYNLHVWKSNCIEIYSKIHIKFLNNSIPFRYSCLVKINWLLIDFFLSNSLRISWLWVSNWTLVNYRKKCVYTKSRSDFFITISNFFTIKWYEFNSQYYISWHYMNLILNISQTGSIHFYIPKKMVRFFVYT